MKKKFPSRGWIISRPLVAVLLSLLCAASLARSASASQELDRKYALRTVGFLRSWDNVDGLFADYVAVAYKDYFSRQSRFVLQDLSKADTVLSRSKLPYAKLIQDDEILGQVARATKSETIIRTRILKEGPQYRFTIDWLLSPQMVVLGTESFVLQGPENGKSFGLGDIQSELQNALDRVIQKVPFVANITGRDNQSVTINIGHSAALNKGDTLLIATVDEVKKHPLLKEVVDWKLTKTGRVEIEEADERIAFGKVVEEELGRKIGRYQKVTQILPYQPPEVTSAEASEEDKPEELPKLGWVSGGLGFGTFSRQYSSSDGAGQTGGGFIFGPRAEGQLWLNRDWFVDLGFGYGFWSHSQQDLATGAATAGTGAGGSLNTMRVDAGYSYLVTGDFFGPKGWVKLGYQTNSYTLPLSTSEQTGPISVNAFFLGVGGDLPLRGNWTATINLDFGLLSSGSASGGVYPSLLGASHVNVSLGALYRFSPKIAFRGGLEILGNGAEFSTTGTSLSQKTVTLTPSLLYYF